MKKKKMGVKKGADEAGAVAAKTVDFKLGLVLECDSGGPDELVLSCLARRLKLKIQVVAATLGSKKQIFLKGPEAAQELVESSKCDLVLIVWDLKPYWEEAESKTCEAETKELRDKIAAVPANVRSKIRLLCLTWELETWLIADHRAVREHLSTAAHKSKFKCNTPLTKYDAKAYLDSECRKHRGRRYEDVREAIKIARLIPDTSKVREIPSFGRFSSLVAGNADADFQKPGEACKDLVYQAHQLGR